MSVGEEIRACISDRYREPRSTIDEEGWPFADAGKLAVHVLPSQAWPEAWHPIY